MPLTIKPPRRPSTTAQTPSESASPISREAYSEDRGHSPEAPPASPLTPVVQPVKPVTLDPAASVPESIELPPNGHAALYYNQDASRRIPSAQFIEQPATQPFSGDDSTDAIALRAAISSLQFQRVTAQRDLRALEEIKRQAIQRPDEFRQHILVQGGLRAAVQKPSLQQLLSQEPNQDDDENMDEENAVTGADDDISTKKTYLDAPFLRTGEVPDSQQSPTPLSSFGSMTPAQTAQSFDQQTVQSRNFPPIPDPQEVVRCPPIEWAKYNIVGESLDKLHRQQQLHPGNGGANSREGTIAARYDPFLDKFIAEEQRSSASTEDRKDSAASATEQLAQRRRSSKAIL